MPEIYLYNIAATLKEVGLERAQSLLDSGEKEQVDKIKAESRLNEFVLGRYLLKKRLSEQTGQPAETLVLQKRAYGKLYLEGNPCFFNLSHSGNYLVVAISQKDEIGVDIEHVTRRSTHYTDIAQRYFTQAEGHAIKDAPSSEQSILFHEVWTKKEAVLKAAGIGLSGSLDAFNALETHPSTPIELLIKSAENAAMPEKHYAFHLKHWQFNDPNQTPVYLSASVCNGQVLPNFILHETEGLGLRAAS